MSKKTLLTVYQASIKTGLKQPQILAAIHKNALPAKLLGANTGRGFNPIWHIEKEDLEAFMESLVPNDFRTYSPAEVRDIYLGEPKLETEVETSKDCSVRKKIERLEDDLWEKKLTKEVWD
jgi:hypothetical protein